MAAGKQYPLKVVIDGVDHATPQLRKLGATIDRVQSQLGKRLAALDRTARITEGWKGVGTAISGVGKALGTVATRFSVLGGAAAYGFARIVTDAVEAGDALQKLSDRLALPVNRVASLRFVAARAGIDEESFDSSIEQFSRRLGQAKLGTGPLQASLGEAAPGVLRDLKRAKDTSVALDVMFRTINRIGDANQRAAVATAAFGRAGAAMTNMASEDLPALLAEYQRLAGDQEAFAKSAGALDDVLDNLKVAFQGLLRGGVTPLMPALGDLGKRLTEIFVAKRGEISAWAEKAGKAIATFAEELPQKIDNVIAKFKEFKGYLDPIAEAVGGWPNLAAGVGTAILAGPLISALASLTAAFVSLGIAIGVTPLGWILIGLVALGAIAVTLMNKWAPVLDFFKELWRGIEDVFVGGYEVIAGLANFDITRALKGGDRAGARVKQLAFGTPTPDNYFVPLSRSPNAKTRERAKGGPAAAPANVPLPALPSGFFSQPFWTPAGPVPLPPVGDGRLQQSAGMMDALVRELRGRIQLEVDFKNVPRGVDVRTTQTGDRPFSLAVGRQMAR